MNFKLNTSTTKNCGSIFKTIALWSVLALSMAACSDKDDPAPSSDELTTLITSKVWTVKSMNAIVDGKTYADKTTLDKLETTFKPDGTYSDYYTDDKSTEKGTWKLNGKTLTITPEDGIVLNGEVSQSSGTELLFSLPQTDISSITDIKDLEDIKPTDKDYMAYVQIAILYVLGDFQGFDYNSEPKKIQVVLNYSAK